MFEMPGSEIYSLGQVEGAINDYVATLCLSLNVFTSPSLGAVAWCWPGNKSKISDGITPASVFNSRNTTSPLIAFCCPVFVLGVCRKNGWSG